MPNPNPSYNHLPKPQGGWNHSPTKPVRIPEVFENNALSYVRSLDGQCSPMDSIIAVLDKLSPDELEQIKLAIDCLSGSAENKSNTKTQATTAIQFVSVPDSRLSDKQIASYKSRFGFIPSNFQLNIIDWIINRKGNACCNAVAGSGKTSTLKLVATTLWQIGFRPNEIKICVFGKKNSVDLIEKFGKVWQSSISTLHSTGFALIRKELNVTRSEEIIINKYKYKRIAQDLNLISKPGLKKGLLRSENIIGDDDDFLKLIDLVRTSNQRPTAEVIQSIAYQYEIDNIHNSELLAQWIAYCLKIGEQMAIAQKKLDYTDQIWLAVKWKLHERS